MAAAARAVARLDADRPGLSVLRVHDGDVAHLLAPARLPAGARTLAQARRPWPARELHDRGVHAALALGGRSAADRPQLPRRVGGETVAAPPRTGCPGRHPGRRLLGGDEVRRRPGGVRPRPGAEDEPVGAGGPDRAERASLPPVQVLGSRGRAVDLPRRRDRAAGAPGGRMAALGGHAKEEGVGLPGWRPARLPPRLFSGAKRRPRGCCSRSTRTSGAPRSCC